MRLVWTFSTGWGVGVRLRSAAAAAAEDRLLEEGWDLRKAWEAADWADCDEGDENCQVSILVCPLGHREMKI